MEKRNILETRHLTKNYGKVKAIIDLNLQIYEGQVYGILGPNGSGKTTTLSIATGILTPDSGNHFWFGKEPSPVSLKKIGSMIEVPHFYPYLNLVQNLKDYRHNKRIWRRRYRPGVKDHQARRTQAFQIQCTLPRHETATWYRSRTPG